MANELEISPQSDASPVEPSTNINLDTSNEVEKISQPADDQLPQNTCQYCCCRFPIFVGSILKSSKNSSTSTDTEGEEYKPYFELETEEEKLSYEYFKLLARVTYDEVVEKHREQVLEELHQYRLSLLLKELRLIEETDILYSSSDECFSEFRIKIPGKRRSLRIKNRKRQFQKQKIRK